MWERDVSVCLRRWSVKVLLIISGHKTETLNRATHLHCEPTHFMTLKQPSCATELQQRRSVWAVKLRYISCQHNLEEFTQSFKVVYNSFCFHLQHVFAFGVCFCRYSTLLSLCKALFSLAALFMLIGYFFVICSSILHLKHLLSLH